MKRKILAGLMCLGACLYLIGGSAFAGAQRPWNATVDPTPGGGNQTADGFVQFNSAKTVTHQTTLSDNCDVNGNGDGYGIFVRVIINTPVVATVDPIYRLTSGCATGDTYGQQNRLVNYQGVARPELNVQMQYGYTDSGSNTPTGSACFRNTEYIAQPGPC